MAPRMKVETSSSAQSSSAPKQEAAATAPATTGVPKTSAPKPKIEAPQTNEQPEPTAKSTQTSRPKTSVETPAPATEPTSQAAVQPAAAVDSAPASRPTVSSKIKITATPTQNESAGEAQDEYDATAYGVSATQPAPQAAPQQVQPTQPATKRVSQWFHRTFAGHEHAFWGAVIALLIAILTFVIGFWRMLLVCVLVLVGVAVGQIFDGDPKIIRTIRGLFNNDQDEQ